MDEPFDDHLQRARGKRHGARGEVGDRLNRGRGHTCSSCLDACARGGRGCAGLRLRRDHVRASGIAILIRAEILPLCRVIPVGRETQRHLTLLVA